MEEQRRLAEGADALLNLAGVRRLSSSENNLSVISYTTNYVHQHNNGHEHQQNSQKYEQCYNAKPQYEEIQETKNSTTVRTKFKPRLLRRPKRRISATDSSDGKYYSSKNLNKFYDSKRIKIDKY